MFFSQCCSPSITLSLSRPARPRRGRTARWPAFPLSSRCIRAAVPRTKRLQSFCRPSAGAVTVGLPLSEPDGAVLDMTKAALRDGLRKLSLAERLELAEVFWNSIAAEREHEPFPLTADQRADLEPRLAEADADPCRRSALRRGAGAHSAAPEVTRFGRAGGTFLRSVTACFARIARHSAACPEVQAVAFKADAGWPTSGPPTAEWAMKSRAAADRSGHVDRLYLAFAR